MLYAHINEYEIKYVYKLIDDKYGRNSESMNIIPEKSILVSWFIDCFAVVILPLMHRWNSFIPRCIFTSSEAMDVPSAGEVTLDICE